MFPEKKTNTTEQRIDKWGIKCTDKCEQKSSEHPEEAPGLTLTAACSSRQHTHPGAVWLLL